MRKIEGSDALTLHVYISQKREKNKPKFVPNLRFRFYFSPNIVLVFSTVQLALHMQVVPCWALPGTQHGSV